jgi:lipopolysaccharide/colanic/teichoic acid biosynthesis glycosyltransferase
MFLLAAFMNKRLLDIFASGLGIVVLAPVFLLCAIAILLDDGGPILFRQQRVGLNFQSFEIIKFRSMTFRKNNVTSAVTSKGDARVTRTGAILRRFKLDELPQLFNVLKGEMSLVGPRPEVPHLFEKYPNSLKQIMAGLKPGLTDFASIEFREENDMIDDDGDPERQYIEKIMPVKEVLIVKYASEQSFWTDIRLIFRTLVKIVG